MKTCSNCGFEFDGNFCSNCGNSNEQNSGTPIPPTANNKSNKKKSKIIIAVLSIALISVLSVLITILVTGSNSSDKKEEPDFIAIRSELRDDLQNYERILTEVLELEKQMKSVDEPSGSMITKMLKLEDEYKIINAKMTYWDEDEMTPEEVGLYYETVARINKLQDEYHDFLDSYYENISNE